MALPSSKAWPSLGAKKPAMVDSSVVLPHPDAPIATTNSPSVMVRFTWESASTTVCLPVA